MHLRVGGIAAVGGIGATAVAMALVQLQNDTGGSLVGKVAGVILDVGIVGFLGWMGVKLTEIRERVATFPTREEIRSMQGDADAVHEELRNLITAATEARVQLTADVRTLEERLEGYGDRLEVHRNELDDHRRLLDLVDQKDTDSRHNLRNQLHEELVTSLHGATLRMDGLEERIANLERRRR